MQTSRDLLSPYAAAIRRVIERDELSGAHSDRIEMMRGVLADLVRSEAPTTQVAALSGVVGSAVVVDLVEYRRRRAMER